MLVSPPPRPAGVHAQRAIGRVRARYAGLLVVPLALLVMAVQRGPDPVAFAVPVMLGVAFVIFVESNVRAIRRLVRDGEVGQGVVDRSRRVRGGRQVWVRFSREGRPRSVAALVPPEVELALGSVVPVLAAPGYGLAGVIVGADDIRVGPVRAA